MQQLRTLNFVGNMTISELIEIYLDGEITAIGIIRQLSGMFNPDDSVRLLALICAITRVEDGDLSKDLFRECYLSKSVSE